MSDNSSDGTDHEGDPVVAKITGELKARYPDWRLTTHYTPEGRKVTMIEFADADGEFTEGLSGEFVSMVSQAYGRSQDTETERTGGSR